MVAKACIGALLGASLLLVGCDRVKPTPSADQDQQKQTERMMREANNAIGMPNLSNYHEKRQFKTILELRDQADLVTYAYFVTWEGELIYFGQCIGFGLPYSVQYTSPVKAVKIQDYLSSTVPDTWLAMPQPDPNGLYMPEGLSATWLAMINPETGEPQPVYVEPQIVVSPFKLH